MTKEQILKSKILSPGIIGGSIVKFLDAGKNTFFLKHEGSEDYLKDENGKYVKMAIDDVLQARMLYLSSFEEKEKEEAIQRQVEKLADGYIKKANEVIEKITIYDSYRKEDSVNMQILEKMNRNIYEQKIKEVEAFWENNPTALEYKEMLEKAIEDKDYESLFSVFEDNLIASFSTIGELEALKNIFGIDNLAKTIEERNQKGSLHLKAKVEVEKRYHPEN
jgi:hypothetical protein